MLSSKIINNLAAMSGAFLLGERPKYNAQTMAELWSQIVEAEAEVKRLEENKPMPDAENDKP